MRAFWSNETGFYEIDGMGNVTCISSSPNNVIEWSVMENPLVWDIVNG